MEKEKKYLKIIKMSTIFLVFILLAGMICNAAERQVTIIISEKQEEKLSEISELLGVTEEELLQNKTYDMVDEIVKDYVQDKKNSINGNVRLCIKNDNCVFELEQQLETLVDKYNLTRNKNK
jgi:hypothetical protein